ncbi:MAG: tetratricopeptide repeat protein [Phycisphaerales bacterium]|jgi:hypothetical protein|nr:tetratricopeptide repeat protein [Phycisphaerales bacterium]MBT7171227.1 tetratricopeptide repeat protein [Phycisphaerales bacterium]
MKRLCLCLVLLLAAIALGDTVFLADGSKLVGTVTKDGTTVHVQTPDGKRVTLKSSDVLYVSTGVKKPTGPDPLKPSLKPKATPTTPGPAKPNPASPRSASTTKYHSTDKTTVINRPQSRVFLAMRLLAANKAGPESKTAVTVRHYRSLVHDRKRNIAGRWYEPKDYIDRREKALAIARDAAADLKKGAKKLEPFKLKTTTTRNRTTGRLERGVSTSERNRALRYNQELQEIRVAQLEGRKKMKQAGLMFPEYEVRVFMLGCGAYQSGAYPDALMHFSKLAKERPNMVVYQQAYAMACIKRKSYDRGIKALIATLELDPTNGELRELIASTLKQLPGKEIHSDTVKLAKAALKKTKPFSKTRSGYSSLASSSSGDESIRWLFPAKPVTNAQYQLPNHPYDRFNDYQGVAVPIGPHTLMVDRNVVSDAAQIIIHIDANTSVVGKAKTSYARGLPVTTVEVRSHVFKPVELVGLEERDAAKNTSVFSTNYLPEMNKTNINLIRQQQIDFKTILDGKTKLFMPGESGGPIMTADGKLLGFLSGWTDCLEDDPEFILADHKDLERTIKSANRDPSKYSSAPVVDTSKLPRAKGNTFLIYSLGGEKFELKK